jgi:hypothetical protein
MSCPARDDTSPARTRRVPDIPISFAHGGQPLRFVAYLHADDNEATLPCQIHPVSAPT